MPVGGFEVLTEDPRPLVDPVSERLFGETCRRHGGFPQIPRPWQAPEVSPPAREEKNGVIGKRRACPKDKPFQGLKGLSEEC